MTLITLIGEDTAKVGAEFYFLGPLTECKDCRLKGVCFNLEQGSRYKVSEVRGQRHGCAESEGDVVAVVVDKVPGPFAVPKKGAMEGVTLTYAQKACDVVSCPNYSRCHVPGKTDGQKFTVVKLGKPMQCPLGEDLVEAEII